MRIGVCKLCLEKTELLKKSHIIPNYFYKKHVLDKDGGYEWIPGTDNSKKIQTGVYESDILCKNCDNNLLGSNESYAHDVYYGRYPQDLKPPRGANTIKIERTECSFYECTGWDYTKIKKFYLGILWKMNISTHHIFDQVSLGERYSENVRKFLLGNGESCEDLPVCFIAQIQYDFLKKAIMVPVHFRKPHHEGGHQYILILGQFVHWFYVSRDAKRPPYVNECIISQKGRLRVPILNKSLSRNLLTGLNIGVDVDLMEENFKLFE